MDVILFEKNLMSFRLLHHPRLSNYPLVIMPLFASLVPYEEYLHSLVQECRHLQQHYHILRPTTQQPRTSTMITVEQRAKSSTYFLYNVIE